MLNHHLEEESVAWKTVTCWLLLSFNAGCINAGGFIATGRFVSHVTGFATLFGVDVANSRLDAAIGILSVPLYFLLGAFLAGIMIDHRIYRGKKPRYDYVLGLSAICLFIAAFEDELGSGVRVFGQDLRLKQNYILLVLLCLTSGLQNAAITYSSRRSVRTTHLTGLTTDLGLGIAHMLLLNRSNKEFKLERRTNLLRAGSIGAFILGSVIGALLFLSFGYRGFAVSGLVCIISIFLSVQQVRLGWLKIGL